MRKRGRGKELGVEIMLINCQSTHLNGPKLLGNQLERKFSRLKKRFPCGYDGGDLTASFVAIFHKGIQKNQIIFFDLQFFFFLRQKMSLGDLKCEHIHFLSILSYC
jgi:hypothetical protein